MRKTIYKTEARSAIIAAVVALVVAAPLSNAAHEGVSSAVKIVKGKQGKTGKRGPRGFRGATGATGERGPAGKDAPRPGMYDAKQILPGETVTVLAGGCIPSGVSGGSFSVTSGVNPGLSLVRDGIGGGDLYYFAVVSNPSNDHATIKATATCN